MSATKFKHFASLCSDWFEDVNGECYVRFKRGDIAMWAVKSGEYLKLLDSKEAEHVDELVKERLSKYHKESRDIIRSDPTADQAAITKKTT